MTLTFRATSRFPDVASAELALDKEAQQTQMENSKFIHIYVSTYCPIKNG